MVEGYNFFMQPLVNIPRLNGKEDWRCISIFRTCVACQGRLCTLIIDGGDRRLSNPYQIAWVNDTFILVSSRCLVTSNFSNNFELLVWCDILMMKNTYTIVCNGCKKILHPMKEIPPLNQPKKKLAPLKLEEPSNTSIKKLKARGQPVEELKEVVEASEEPMLDFPRQNIIMSGGKREESTEISFEYREFKNFILLQDNLQEECWKQLSTSLLMTYIYFENYQLILQHWKVF
ncbi:hypothetical protein PVL29_026138 [Vitis rotundifolia]|uniref:Uncharacterized protein n=1 Tax=Vitis rotundifolia TaxID=103349 RepID=A0AA39D5L4_VITRO|nr:hypothetical protein PVL29_026138 [Vitis rotundifolia]